MIFLIIYYFLVTAVCLWAGIALYSFLPAGRPQDRSLAVCLITGLISLTVLGNWVVLIFPLNFSVRFFILLLCFVITLWRRKTILEAFSDWFGRLKKMGGPFFLCLSCFLLMMLVLNAGPTMMDDTESYHIQMVKWIQQYGSVPGIANLHLRFGFNSSWFVAVGLLSCSFRGVNGYLALNGLLALWFCFGLLEKGFMAFREPSSAGSRGQAAACLVLLAICLINWPMIRGCATSANYDFITTCCIVFLFLDLDTNISGPRIEWLIWPLFLFTVRMMNFPLLLLGFYYFLQILRRQGISALTGCLSAILFITVPFLIRNIILSGYVFFPFYQVDIFSVDWKADRARLIDISEYIKYYNRVNPMFMSLGKTRELGAFGWIGAWFRYLFTFDKWLVILALFSYGFTGLSAGRFFSRQQKVFGAVMAAQLLGWFLIAPDPRFVQGSLLFGVYMAIQKSLSLYADRRNLLKTSFLLMGSAVLVYGLYKIKKTEYRNFLVVRPLPVPEVRTVEVDHIKLHIPLKVLNNWNPRCYDIALPCLYTLDPRLRARGGRVADGFRLGTDSLNLPVHAEYKISD